MVLKFLELFLNASRPIIQHFYLIKLFLGKVSFNISVSTNVPFLVEKSPFKLKEQYDLVMGVRSTIC